MTRGRSLPTWPRPLGWASTGWLMSPRCGPCRASAGGPPLAIVRRPGTAGSNPAAEHIEVTRLALAQLPRALRRRVLIRTDSGGGTREFLAWLAGPGRRLHYSIGMTITDDIQQAILQ